MAPGLPIGWATRAVAVAAAVLLSLQGTPTLSMEAEGEAAERCPGAGSGLGACAEDQVEDTEEELALGMRTELLQAEAVRFRAPSAADVHKPARVPAAADGRHEGGEARRVPSKVDVAAVDAAAKDAGIQRAGPTEPPTKNATAKLKAEVLTDPKMINLTYEEQNLSQSVHSQAEVVTKNTAQLSDSLHKAKGVVDKGVEAQRTYTAAHQEVVSAKAQFQDYLQALERTRKHRDQLKNATLEVQHHVQELSDLYEHAVKDYESLLKAMPPIGAASDAAEARQRSVEEQIRKLGEENLEAQFVVSRDSHQLQQALDQLNRLNGKLKDVEGKISKRFVRLKSGAAPAASSPALLLLAGALSAAHLAALQPAVA